MPQFDCIIVGAGHAGTQAAASLRQEGFTGSIALIGDEPDAPYDRPALSKDYLLGKKSFDSLRLRPDAFWEKEAITLLTGREVTGVDPVSKTIATREGEGFGYGSLIWATGGRPRRASCAGHDLTGVHYVRSRQDVDRILAGLSVPRRVAIIGGGFVGLEAAAALSVLGRETLVVEAADRLMARVTGPEIAAFYQAEHAARGVRILTRTSLLSIAGEAGQVSGVALSSGETLPVDMVILGIGILPNIEPLRAAGAEGTDGITVDTLCRTSLPDVHCIGDCARMPGLYPTRLESIQNANDQARTVARLLCGRPEPHAATPWFWSNQYDLRMQTIGCNFGYDTTVLRGDPGQRSFSVAYLRDGVLLALDCVNAARDYVQGRKLVEQRAVIPADRLADTTVALRDLSHSPAPQ